MLKEIASSQNLLEVAEQAAPAKVSTRSSLGERVRETIPGIVSWLILSAPIWLTLLSPTLGFAFVGVCVIHFMVRSTLFGGRGLLNRRRILSGMREDWLARLQAESSGGQLNWRDCRITFLIRAFREGNLDMLRNTLSAIAASNWPSQDGRLHGVEVVFATEEHDPITPPLVEVLAAEFRDKLHVRQIRHPHEPGTLPGPSTAMHYVGRMLYREAEQQGRSTQNWLVADLDSDTLVHQQYLPCLVYHFINDPKRQQHVYQPVVPFTIDYWLAPLHSRLSAIGTTALTVSWHRRPEIAFTGAAASLALLKSVDFWPTNSHSQDSGIDLRLRLRYGRRFRVLGLPVPAQVYPVMAIGGEERRIGRLRAYVNSFRVLFRQSARWREGPLDEFVEATRRRHVTLILHRLWNGLERDTLTILPGYGYLAARAISSTFYPTWQMDIPGGSNDFLGIASTVALSIASLLGLIVFWQLLSDDLRFVPHTSRRRRAIELMSFWLVFGLYVPILTGAAGLKTATIYMLGRRPRGHFTPTPK